LAFFTTDTAPQDMSFSQDFSLTEDVSIQITVGLSALFTVIAIILSAVAYCKNENKTYIISSMLAGVGVFILMSLKLGLVILLIATSIGLYLKTRLTR
jgi:hypothetical protein